MFREGMNWFVLRVASNKERSVRQTLLRKVQIEGMEAFVGRIMVPTEKVKTLKGNKPRITETMLYPAMCSLRCALSRWSHPARCLLPHQGNRRRRRLRWHRGSSDPDGTARGREDALRLA